MRHTERFHLIHVHLYICLWCFIKVVNNVEFFVVDILLSSPNILWRRGLLATCTLVKNQQNLSLRQLGNVYTFFKFAVNAKESMSNLLYCKCDNNHWAQENLRKRLLQDLFDCLGRGHQAAKGLNYEYEHVYACNVYIVM